MSPPTPTDSPLAIANSSLKISLLSLGLTSFNSALLAVYCALLLPILTTTHAPAATAPSQHQRPAAVYTDSLLPYSYLGCFNETAEMPDADGARARALGGGGKVLVGKGNITVPMCLGYCGGTAGSGQAYEYAGLENSR